MNEKNSVFFIFMSASSIADNLTYSKYFREFTKVFSQPIISARNYSRLSSYKLHAELFVDFRKFPPEIFGSKDQYNSNVIFNGAASKKFFISFVKSAFLNGDTLDGNEKKFIDNVGSYSFQMEVKDGRVVIFENILVSAPESMTAEFSCSYTFDSKNKEPFKLTDVTCAG